MQNLPPGISGRTSDRAVREMDPGELAAADTFTAYGDMGGDGSNDAFLRCSICEQGILLLWDAIWSHRPEQPQYAGDAFREAIRRHAFQAHRDLFPDIRKKLGL